MGSNPVNGGQGDGSTPGFVDQNLLDILLGGEPEPSLLPEFSQGQSPVCREPGTEGALGYSAESYSIYRPAVTPTTPPQQTPVGAERYFASSGLSSTTATPPQMEGILGIGVQDFGYVPQNGRTYVLEAAEEFTIDGLSYEISNVVGGDGVVINVDEVRGFRLGDVIDTGKGSTFRIIKDSNGYKIEITRSSQATSDFQATIDALAAERTSPSPPPTSTTERITVADGWETSSPVGPRDMYSFKRIGDNYYVAREIEIEPGVFEPGPYHPLDTYGFGPDWNVRVETTGPFGQPQLVIEHHPQLTQPEEVTAVFRRPEPRGPVPAERQAVEPSRSGADAADPLSGERSSSPYRSFGNVPANRSTEVPSNVFFGTQTSETPQSVPPSPSESPVAQSQCSESEMGYSAEAYEGYRPSVTPPLNECRDLGAIPRDGAVHLVDATTEFSIDGKSYSVVRYPDGYFLQESGPYSSISASLNRHGVGDVMYTGNGHLLELVEEGGVLKVAVTRSAPAGDVFAEGVNWSDVNPQSESSRTPLERWLNPQSESRQSPRLTPEEQTRQDNARRARVDEFFTRRDQQFEERAAQRDIAEARAAGAEDIEVIGRRGPVPAERQAVEPSRSGASAADPSSWERQSMPDRSLGNSPANRSSEVCANDFFGSQAAGTSQRTTAAPAARAATPSATAETVYSAGVGGFYGVSLSFVNSGIEYVVGREAAPYVEAPADYGVIGAMCMASGSTAASVAAGGPVVAPFAAPASGVARSITQAVGIDPNSTAGRVTESGIAGTILGFATRYLAPAIQAAETAASDLFWPLAVVNVAATAVQHPEETRQVVETVAQVANDGFEHIVDRTAGPQAVELTRAAARSPWNPINMVRKDIETGSELLEGAAALLSGDEVCWIGQDCWTW